MRRPNTQPSWKRFGLSEAGWKRLDTFVLEIVAALRPEAPSTTSGDEVRFGRHSSLRIRPDASWFDYADDAYGADALTLLAHLLDTERHDAAPASVTKFARAWLADHPGEGSFQPTAFDASKVTKQAEQRAAFANQVLRGIKAVADSAAELYLHSRALPGPFPNCVGYYPNARQGEGAVIGIPCPTATLSACNSATSIRRAGNRP